MDAKTTALVLIEFQNDFTREGGTLHGAVAEVMGVTGTLDHGQQALAAAHAAGSTVIHSPISFQPGYFEITTHPYGILKGVVDSTSFVKGTWGCQIDDSMTPADGDPAIEPLFEIVLIEGELGYGKPDRRVFNAALAHFDAHTAESCMIGDNLEADIGGARELGITAVWHDAHGAGLPKQPIATPDRVIRSLSELLD